MVSLNSHTFLDAIFFYFFLPKKKPLVFPLIHAGMYPILECLQNFILALSLCHTCRYKAAAILTSVCFTVCCVLSYPAGI